MAGWTSNDAVPEGDGWLSPAAEAAAYEGIRRGLEPAFRAVAGPLQPRLRRLAALSTTDLDEIDALVARTWEVALGGLDMFHWQTPFATWVAGLAVALVRGHAGPAGPLDPHVHAPAFRPAHLSGTPAGATARVAPGPSDWSDLPWGARWGLAWERLDAAVADLPLPVLEVVHAREVERWAPRRVCDVLGITESGYDRLLAHGRGMLRDSLATLVAAPPATGPLHRAQTDAVLRMLRGTVDEREGPLDARTVAAFQRWRAGRRWRWRLLLHRSLPAPSRHASRS